MGDTNHSKLTPPELAKRFRCKVDKIHIWIRSGELRAVNAAAKLGGRPRWLIDEADVAVFEERRANRPEPKPTRQHRQKVERPAGWVEYFK